MRRFYSSIALLISALILFSVFGCSSAPAEDVFELSFDDMKTEQDFRGETVVLCCSREIVYENPDDYSIFCDLAYKRMGDIEKRYNVRFEYNNIDFNGQLTQALIASGQSICEFAVGNTWWLHDEIKANLFYPIETLDTGIDFTDSKKWGNRYHLSSLVNDDHLYGVVALYWPALIYQQVFPVLFVNEDQVAAVSQPDPREYVEKGEWTRDLFTDLVENKYSHTDAAGEHVFALESSPNALLLSTAFSSGLEFVVRQSDGSYEMGFYTPEAYDKLKWGDDFLWRNWETNIISSAPKYVMTMRQVSMGLQDIQFTINSFGVLPFPLSDDMQGQNWIGMHEGFRNAILIPLNARDPESAAFFADEIFEPLDGYETEDKRMDYYNRYIFHDPRDTRVVFALVDTLRYTPSNEDAYLIPEAMGNAMGSKTVAQILEEQKSKYKHSMETFYIPHEESIIHIFGEK